MFRFLVCSAFAVTLAVGQEAAPTIRTGATLVIVPTLVLASEGTDLPTLGSRDFTVLDNGVKQKVVIDEAERQPLALLVLMQTGGAAPRQFANYAKLGTMLDALVTRPEDRVALVTFDSEPEDTWSFSGYVEDKKEAWEHPQAGDGGAAIFDAVSYGIEMLKKEPAGMRRVVLLLSQTHDAGSKVRADEVVRRLGESNVTIYSVGFSEEKTWLKDQFTKPRHENPPYVLSPNLPPLLHTFDLGTPLFTALSAMKANAAEEIAGLSGGEFFEFGGRKELEQELGTVANHIPNRYMLSFRPDSNAAGLHALRVWVPGHPELQVLARRSYWVDGASGGR